ncbi:MAG: NAD(P)-dependent oxidoreductase, partial [Hyphomicrobiales bacterium]
MAKVAWIGLGVMGYPMAGHIRKKGGHELTVYNRTAAKAQKWAGEFGGNAAATPAEAAKDADFVFCCVGNDNDLRQVTTGPDGAFSTLREGAVFIDNTTASADVARELHAAAKKKGAGFLDAPVSGGQAGAENGVLTVMIGGDEADFRKAEPVIQCFARAATHMGPVGAGRLTKMVNQICIAGLLQGLSEGLHFAQAAGLDIPKAIATISKGA